MAASNLVPMTEMTMTPRRIEDMVRTVTASSCSVKLTAGDFFEEFRMREKTDDFQKKRLKLQLQSVNFDQNCLWNTLHEAMIDAGMPDLDHIKIRQETLNSDSAWDSIPSNCEFQGLDSNGSVLPLNLKCYKEVHPSKEKYATQPRACCLSSL
jgi:hypothetical protein